MADDPEVTREIALVDKVPFTIDHLLAHLQIEADFVVDLEVVTRGQRLVLRDIDADPYSAEPDPSDTSWMDASYFDSLH